MGTKIFLAIGGVLIGIIGFLAGFWWKSERLGALPRYELTKPLEIQIAPEKKGKIPQGVTLYEYRVLPEITTYILFVNTKSRNLLSQKATDKNVSIEPVDAYPAQ